MTDLKGKRFPMLLALTSIITVGPAYAIDANVRGDMATRYIKLSNNLNDFAQANFNLHLTVEANERSKVVTTFRTGGHFSHPWDNYIDIRHKNPEYSPELKPRNLYWQMNGHRAGQFQVGFLPVYNNGINLTSKLSDFGWSDGIRSNYTHNSFSSSLFAGSIGDAVKVNSFDRPMKWDHFEANTKFCLNEKVTLSANVLRSESIYFAQLGGAYRVSTWGQLFIDSLVDQHGESKSSITIDSKSDWLLSSLQASLTYQYMSMDFSRLGTTLSHPLYKSTKSSIIAKAAIPLLTATKLSWFIATKQNSEHLQSLYYTGLSLGFN